jgi:hypothetical protein
MANRLSAVAFYLFEANKRAPTMPQSFSRKTASFLHKLGIKSMIMG